MNPGRELDALIAEKVMGFKDVHFKVCSTFGLDTSDWHMTPDARYPYAIARGCTLQVPHYSTDIAAAWEVVEKLPTIEITNCKGNSLLFDARANEKDKWVVAVRVSAEADYSNPKFIYSQAVSAPHAICLAALKAVSGDPA